MDVQDLDFQSLATQALQHIIWSIREIDIPKPPDDTSKECIVGLLLFASGITFDIEKYQLSKQAAVFIHGSAIYAVLSGITREQLLEMWD